MHTAPFFTASSTYSLPSFFTPFNAKNILPFFAVEDLTTSEVISSSPASAEQSFIRFFNRIFRLPCFFRYNNIRIKEKERKSKIFLFTTYCLRFTHAVLIRTTSPFFTFVSERGNVLITVSPSPAHSTYNPSFFSSLSA